MPDASDLPTPPLPPSARLAEALAAYVSPLVLENLARPPGAHAAELEGAVLLTDIAGFTALTERMDAAGPAGAEELSRVLNAYFTDLIVLLETHGGRVEKFAGDALVAVWPAAPDTLAAAAQRAAQCALALQRQMPVRNPADGVALSMRVSLGAGTVQHMLLGGPGQRWAARLAGPALTDAREAIAQAEPGDVVLAPTVARLLASVAQTAAQPGGGARLVEVEPAALEPAPPAWVQPGDVAALFGHVPAAARDRIVAGHAGWLAEFRRVSVIFIHVPEVDDQPARSLERGQAVMEKIQIVLARFGGTVDDLGDDRPGFTLVAAFGLPGWTHEDNALRAVRTALAVRAELRALGFSPALGVTTGRLFCGAIGSARRRSYSMVGDAMNRCARLMARAENDVLCDHATRQAAEPRLRFEFLRAEELKGKASAVAIHRPLGEAAAPPPQRRGIVGRAPERALLQARLDALDAGGAAGVVLIEGDAGIGKSTLVAELRGMAADAGLRVLAGSGDLLERAHSYRPWREILGDVLGFPADADETERGDLLRLFFTGQPEVERLAPLLNPMLGLHLPDNEITAEMTGRPRAEATRALLVEFLTRAAATEPLVVVLEDAHWADSASLALALDVQRKVPRVLLVLATRPLDDELPEPWPQLREAAGAHRLALGPLADDEVLALVCQRLGVDTLPASAAQFIRAKAEGHPFFSEELGYALRDAGHLVVRGRHGTLASGVRDLRGLDFPATVKGVVQARLDRLSEREQMAIKIASVCGRAFSREILEAIHPLPDDRAHLPACLERLETLAFTRRGETGGSAAFVFQHSIIQEVAYEQLPFAKRQALHTRLAEYLEQHEALNFVMLAHHWEQTATPRRAVAHLDRAGQQALRRYANHEARDFFTRAIALTEHGGDRPAPVILGRWHRQIGEAHHHLGAVEESRRWLAQARQILGYPVPAPTRMKMLALPVAAARQCWHRLTGRGRAARGAVSAEVLDEAIQADNQLGEIAYFTNDLPTSVYHIIHGLNLAEALGPVPKLAEMYAAMMILTGAIPPPALGRRYFRLTEQVLAETKPPLTHAYVEQLMGIYFNGLGDFRRAQTRLESALETFRRFGHGRRIEECLVNLFYVQMYRGEVATAHATAALLHASAARRDDPQTLGWAVISEARTLLLLEGPAAARARLGSEPAPGWDLLTHTAFHASLAVVHFRLGESGPAGEHARQALTRLTAGPPVSYTALHDCAHTAEVFLGLLAEARRTGTPAAGLAASARRACATLRTFARSFAIGTPRAHLWSGVGALPRRSVADRHWQKARAAAMRLAMPDDLALLDSLQNNGGDAHAKLAHRPPPE
ncbi:MAG: AAA family ATPase [Chthoniobacter sp.]|nr:AAA family ATPase [Chthoniobacter sp.]